MLFEFFIPFSPVESSVGKNSSGITIAVAFLVRMDDGLFQSCSWYSPPPLNRFCFKHSPLAKEISVVKGVDII